jgi:hypothetical protein
VTIDIRASKIAGDLNNSFFIYYLFAVSILSSYAKSVENAVLRGDRGLEGLGRKSDMAPLIV